MSANPSLSAMNMSSNEIHADSLSIALVGPDLGRRLAVLKVLTGCGNNEIREYSSYPRGLRDVSKLLEARYDVIVIDLDCDPKAALELVESIGSNGVATVMVYSDNTNPDLLMRCMRAGAREFLTLPFSHEVVDEAMARAAARRQALQSQFGERKSGKLLVFMGSKGGTGTTTLACNFAVALARAPKQQTLLIDLDLPLGDAALNLGLSADFSAIEALQSPERLDARLLSQLVVKHSSGLSVLAAPGRFVSSQATTEAIDMLMQVAREEFDNVVVDIGSRFDLMETAVYRNATTIYLITQASIPELRNSNRLITQFFSAPQPRLEIVVNRFEPRAIGVSEEHITRALTRPAQWKIPNDYAAVRNMQIHATPLVLEDSSISRQIWKMAETVIGKELEEASPQPQKKGFWFFK